MPVPATTPCTVKIYLFPATISKPIPGILPPPFAVTLKLTYQFQEYPICNDTLRMNTPISPSCSDDFYTTTVSTQIRLKTLRAQC